MWGGFLIKLFVLQRQPPLDSSGSGGAGCHPSPGVPKGMALCVTLEDIGDLWAQGHMSGQMPPVSHSH